MESVREALRKAESIDVLDLLPNYVTAAITEVETWEATRWEWQDMASTWRRRAEKAEAERDKLGNELAQERAKPGGVLDQAAFTQIQAEREGLAQALRDIASPRMLKSRDAMIEVAREALAREAKA